MREALEAAIAADPQADAPRLVAADWAEGQGDEAWAWELRSFVALRRVLENPVGMGWREAYAALHAALHAAHGRTFEAKEGEQPLRFVKQYEIPDRETDRFTGTNYVRNLLHAKGFDMSRHIQERRYPETPSVCGFFRYWQVTEFTATYRIGFIERISGSLADWRRVGWPLLKEHPIRNIEFSDMEERRVEGGTFSFTNDYSLPRRIVIRRPRLHLRKQGDDSWAAHWLGVKDKEPDHLLGPWKEYAERKFIGFPMKFDGCYCYLWSDRSALLDGLPRFLEECLRQQPRFRTTDLTGDLPVIMEPRYSIRMTPY